MSSLFKGLFVLRGTLTEFQKLVFGVVGAVLLIVVWFVVVETGLSPRQILPSPIDVLNSFPELHFKNFLVRNIGLSLERNFQGYFYAILAAIPVGFLLGLIPLFRGLGAPAFNALRYLPLTAAAGLFIVWFGIGELMKVSFLAFAIFVYLVPTVIQRIDEVRTVYLHTAVTLGAGKLQTIRHVYVPDVLSRVWSDIIVLVALSWTYIIFVEMINTNDGGIGALAYMVAERQSRPDKNFALLFVIILIGFLQDRLFRWVGGMLFPHKHAR